ncbi:MAG: hypothetical protein WCG81_14850 [Candidatus Angelobacter sp.]
MSDYQSFWNWFIEHEQELLNFEEDRERIFDELAAALQKVDSDLTFEFGSKDLTREFVISAGGIKRAFPAVTALTAAAPPLKNWEITAFRPRRNASQTDPLRTVEFRGKRVDAKNVQFTLLDNGQMAGIYLFIPGFKNEDEDLQQIAYLLLDNLLGEYDVETRLGLIKIFSPEAKTQGERYSISALPSAFDELTAKLKGKSDFQN